MGACALAAHEAGGKVLGVIPKFLTSHERPLPSVNTVIVTSMHERKMMMFEESDGFIILPGGIGTLEEVIELLSWRRLALHSKPIVFYKSDTGKCAREKRLGDPMATIAESSRRHSLHLPPSVTT